MKQIYKDKKINIEFSKFPNVSVRYPMIYMTEEEKEECIKKPFICLNSVLIRITDYEKKQEYNFMIPKNYTWDGASIPRAFWRIIGSKTDPEFLIPSMIHDYLCEHHESIGNNRYLADKIFERLLYISEVNSFLRWLMFHSVDNFQKFCGWNRKG